MTEGWTSAVMEWGEEKKRKQPRSADFVFTVHGHLGTPCTQDLMAQALPRGHAGGHRSAGACTKPKVKGCSSGPPPAGRGKARRGVPRPPAGLPRRGTSPLAALAGVRRVRGCRAPAPYRRLELSTRRGVIHTRVSPRYANERRWAAASDSSCNLPPSSPRPESVFLLFIFFRCTRCCLPPQPLAAAGRHPLAAACTQRVGGDGEHRSTAAVKGSCSP